MEVLWKFSGRSRVDGWTPVGGGVLRASGLEMSDAYVRFPPFLLDHVAGCLLRDGEALHLRPRTWDVLCYLVARPGQLVTKDELLDSVWSDAIVSEGTLTSSIRELRAALGDDARSPRYIETVHRRGFRFVAPLAHVESLPTASASPPRPATTAHPAATSAVAVSATAFVGRQSEVDRLLQLAQEASAGATHIVLVRGEAGIGKSALVDRFAAALDRDAGRSGIRIAKGRAIGYLRGA